MIQQPDQSAAPLEPPRPNLGPEPLGPDGPSALALSALLGALLILAALAVLWRRRRLADRIAEPPEPPRDASPEARLLALRDRARAILVRRFGPALRARTTEEVAADARLAEALGGDDLARLTDLLRAGDRLLFDREAIGEASGDPPADLAGWSALLEALSRAR